LRCWRRQFVPENLSNQGQRGDDFGGIAEGGVIGGGWDIKAYHDLLIFEESIH
jgi:hypothetical protein